MIDPLQTPTAAAPSASTPDAPVSSVTTSVGAAANAEKPAAPSNASPSAQTAQAANTAQTAQTAGSNGGNDSQAASDAAQPLRLLIEHDKSTNQYVYKLYDASGRIVREIPQESLAEAQKQASGAPGALFDTKV